MSYTFRGRTPRVLTGGRPIARGEQVTDREAGDNPRLVESGLLVKDPVKVKPSPTKPKKTTGGSGIKQTTDGSENTDAAAAAPKTEEA